MGLVGPAGPPGPQGNIFRYFQCLYMSRVLNKIYLLTGIPGPSGLKGEMGDHGMVTTKISPFSFGRNLLQKTFIDRLVCLDLLVNLESLAP